MPEAVASNSRPASERQPSQSVLSEVMDALIKSEDAIYALGGFVAAEVEDHSGEQIANGIAHLFHREVEQISAQREKLFELWKALSKTALPRAQAGMKQPVWSDLFVKVSAIVRQAMEDCGRNVPPEDGLLWSNEDRDKHFQSTLTHYLLIMERLGGSDDPFEAGSFLPWAELLIRKELGSLPGAMSAEPVSPKSMRDQFIAEMHREGRTPSEISQALSLRQSTVLRTIDRLTGRQEGGERKAG